MRRLVNIATVVAISMLLSGCITTALYLANRPTGPVLREMARWCVRDAGVHWYGPRLQGAELWLPGQMNHDPVGPEGLTGLEPYPSLWNNDLAWLRSGSARVLYVNVAPRYEHDAAIGFGPRKGEPEGLYRVELAPPGDARCGPFLAYRDRLARAIAPAPLAPEPDPRCVTYERIGPMDFASHPNLFIRYDDKAAGAHGFSRVGEVLLVGGSPRARQTNYSAYSPHGSSEHSGTWGVAACAAPIRSLPDTL